MIIKREAVNLSTLTPSGVPAATTASTPASAAVACSSTIGSKRKYTVTEERKAQLREHAAKMRLLKKQKTTALSSIKESTSAEDEQHQQHPDDHQDTKTETDAEEVLEEETNPKPKPKPTPKPQLKRRMTPTPVHSPTSSHPAFVEQHKSPYPPIIIYTGKVKRSFLRGMNKRRVQYVDSEEEEEDFLPPHIKHQQEEDEEEEDGQESYDHDVDDVDEEDEEKKRGGRVRRAVTRRPSPLPRSTRLDSRMQFSIGSKQYVPSDKLMNQHPSSSSSSSSIPTSTPEIRNASLPASVGLASFFNNASVVRRRSFF